MSWFKKDPLQIIPFQSYGTASHFHIRGRALEDEKIDLSQKSYFNLLINSWKRFESDEIKHVLLDIKLPNNRILNVKTDSHGYYHVEETINGLDQFIDDHGWLNYEVSYADANIKRTIQQKNKFRGELLIPSGHSNFGVISDIDDTILHTGVVSNLKWQVIFNTLFKNAAMRSPLNGASEFYQKLHKGKSGLEANPIFYVSHSPWNLYRYLEYFLSENDFPKGPILLRSFKTILRRKSKGEKPQKHKEILKLLETYPELQFILIGDSGERDPDIYLEISQQFPSRIKAIYLRQVKNKKKINRVKNMLSGFKSTPALLVRDSQEAIIHAKSLGFI
ncbi:MAG: DUF2183 domain-containing protein [Flavobacteriaceae bacterium]|nr:MAG: DUF2183 domain-containing protein [Flavobacteriaceae bacterium]